LKIQATSKSAAILLIEVLPLAHGELKDERESLGADQDFKCDRLYCEGKDL
jgi:hypothetical protein